MHAGRDVDYAALREEHAGARVPCEWLESSEPSYILFTSGTTGTAERRAARHRRLCGCARVVDAANLLPCTRRDDVLHERHRLGRRPLVHRLRPADQRLDDDHVRRAADPSRRRHLVEDRRGARRQDDVQLADGDPRAEEAGSCRSCAVTTCRRCATCSSPASRSTSPLRAGPPTRWAWRSSTTTGRPNRAGRSSPRSSASRRRRASSARRRSPCTATT